MERQSTDLGKCKDKLKMLKGIPPHNRGFNICLDDSWFEMSIERDFTKDTIEKAKAELRNEYPEYRV